MMTSSLLPTAVTISVMSSSAQGESSGLIRVHNPVAPKSTALAMAMKPARAAYLRVGRDGVLEIAEDHIDLAHERRHFRRDLLDVRRNEMDHALKPHRQFAQRHGRADRERLVELSRMFHGRSYYPPCRAIGASRQVDLDD